MKYLQGMAFGVGVLAAIKIIFTGEATFLTIMGFTCLISLCIYHFLQEEM